MNTHAALLESIEVCVHEAAFCTCLDQQADEAAFRGNTEANGCFKTRRLLHN